MTPADLERIERCYSYKHEEVDLSIDPWECASCGEEVEIDYGVKVPKHGMCWGCTSREVTRLYGGGLPTLVAEVRRLNTEQGRLKGLLNNGSIENAELREDLASERLRSSSLKLRMSDD